MAQLVKIITEETLEKDRKIKEEKTKTKLSVLCPVCNSETRIYHKKNFLDKSGYIRRYRECKACGYKFVTIQTYSEEQIMEARKYERKN